MGETEERYNDVLDKVLDVIEHPATLAIGASIIVFLCGFKLGYRKALGDAAHVIVVKSV